MLRIFVYFLIIFLEFREFTGSITNQIQREGWGGASQDRTQQTAWQSNTNR